MCALSEKQRESWQQGACTSAHLILGAHAADSGIRFGVWAPNAKELHVVGDFNNWDARAHPMRKDEKTGIWHAVVSEARAGQCYKFSINPQKGSSFLKADPYGFYQQGDSHKASVIYPLPDFNWRDDEWMSQRQQLHQPDRPLSIYEVHAGSWKRKPSGKPLSYVELADELIPYVKEMGFTHIELMPIMEHPYDPSWGYQITGYFAPTGRYGKPEDFMAFVNACHRRGIGVILDWVPGHFPRDEHALALFDGTPLYEHANKKQREHADWGTHNFDFDKPGVRNFLLSNAFFWCEKYHIDGFRVDAVASMLYLDYSKPAGEWEPNIYGGKENLGAIAFLQDFNKKLHQEFPSVLSIAEESTSWPGVTRSVAEGGLGFNYKWNMGWMNDTLHYFVQTPDERRQESHSITFPATFAFDEQFILPFSHDEVVHLKKSLWSKMPGSDEQKFRQLKLLFLYLVGCPGKKLLFMGGELAEHREWSEGRALNWLLLDDPRHKGIRQFVAELLQFYKSEPILYTSDHTREGFKWVDLKNKEKGVFAFLRRSVESGNELLFIFNFMDQPVDNYSLSGFGGAAEKLVLCMDTLGEYPQIINTEGVTLKPFQGLVLTSRDENHP